VRGGPAEPEETAMRRSVLSLSLVALSLTLGAVACSKSDTTATTSPTASAVSSGNNGNNGNSSGGNGSSSGGGAASTLPGGITVPGGADINKVAGDAQKCADLLTGYSGLFAPLMGANVSSDDRSKAETALENMKGQVPDNIAKDLETVEAGIKNANDIVALGNFLSSDEYTKANTEITDYFTNQCSKVGQ
jgi:hypothetical protein